MKGERVLAHDREEKIGAAAVKATTQLTRHLTLQSARFCHPFRVSPHSMLSPAA